MRLALVAFSAAALAALSGCGGSPPATPDAAWFVSLVSNTGNCSIADTMAQFGSVTEENRQAVLLNGAMSDGDTASVACYVAPVAGSTTEFTMEGTATLGLNSLEIAIGSITSGATQAKPAIGKASFISAATAEDTYASSACNFYFAPNTQEGVLTEQIWVSFDCPMLTYGQGDSTCNLAQGIAIFENCFSTVTND
jgi:hypothetical protein